MTIVNRRRLARWVRLAVVAALPIWMAARTDAKPSAERTRDFDASDWTGTYFHAGNCAIIEGDDLEITNELGDTETGVLTDSTHVVVAAWDDLVGQLHMVGGVKRTAWITWSNGTTWFGPWAGPWWHNGNAVFTPQSNGSTYVTNDLDDTEVAYFSDDTHVVVPGYGYVEGTLSADGTRIDWSDDTSWYRIPFGSWLYGTSPCSVSLVDGALTVTNEMDDSELAYAVDDGHIIVPGWDGLIGTLYPDIIVWSNSTEWNRAGVDRPRPFGPR